MRIAVNVSHLTDETMSFFGFHNVKEGDEFKVYTDKYQENHIVRKSYPFVFVDSEHDADAMKASDRISGIPPRANKPRPN